MASAMEQKALAERVALDLAAFPRHRRRNPILQFAAKKPVGAISAAILLVLILSAILAPWIAPYDPIATDADAMLAGPGMHHFFGTDDMGRDMFSRILWGARVSLWVGILAVVLGEAVGASLGLASAYFGGKVDLVMQRIADTIMSFPGLVFLLVVVSMLGQGITNAMFAISILIWPGANRVMRSAVLSVKENTYIEAARAIGASDLRIILRHIAPNVTSVLIIVASVTIGNAILLEASLGFLGLGVQPPTAAWGSMLSRQGRAFFERAPWMAFAPGLAISITVLAFNLLGDALRDVWDPRLRGTH